MEFIDGPLQQSLRLSRRPKHLIATNAVVDPARRIALKQRVGNRRYQKRGTAEYLQQQGRALALGQVLHRNTADQMIGQRGCRHGVEPRSYSHRRHAPDTVGCDPPIEQPAARLGTFQRLTQQFVELQNLDSALPHLEDEVEVILARFMHPKYVVEQQISTIARGQSLMRKSGTTDQHGSQFAYFRMNTELPFHGESARKD